MAALAVFPQPSQPVETGLHLVLRPLERNDTFRQLREEGIMPLSDRTLKRIFEDESGVTRYRVLVGRKRIANGRCRKLW